jgi:hypothetical protein
MSEEEMSGKEMSGEEISRGRNGPEKRWFGEKIRKGRNVREEVSEEEMGPGRTDLKLILNFESPSPTLCLHQIFVYEPVVM